MFPPCMHAWLYETLEESMHGFRPCITLRVNRGVHGIDALVMPWWYTGDTLGLANIT